MQNFFLFAATISSCLRLISAAAALDYPYSHTHTHTSIELKPVSLQNSYLIASVCFLGSGCGDNGHFNKVNDNYELDTKTQCNEAGYSITECRLPNYLIDACPFDAVYYARCQSNPSRACSESGYVNSCVLGKVLDASQVCPYDNSFQKCKCNPCDEYAYTLSQASAEGYVADGSCMSCNTPKYKRKDDPCVEFNECECGGEIGTDVCLSGKVKKFLRCKACYVPCLSETIDVNTYWCGGAAKCYVK